MSASHTEFHPDRPLKCLLMYPAFPESAYWNWKEVCHALGRQAMGIPLGMITFAATLPRHWEMRLMDLNAVPWDDEAWRWADLVCVGGMIIQQSGVFEIIERARRDGKFVIVGGPDATSQPTLYENADALVLGEAETTVPVWLDAWRQGHPRGKFQVHEKPDVTQSPVPRFDLLNMDDYLCINVQFSRGCPFNCEFCDIIELFGRKPRTKAPEQFCRELETLYDLGYRGWVDVVDDNFVGNRRNVKQMLPVLKEWSEKRGYPFYYSTQASINLADDEPLMDAMTEVDFRIVFVGIETPDPKLLATTQKRMNAHKPITDRIAKIYDHGLSVTAGFILGFDGESKGAGDVIIECIEENAVPIAMASLLAALPNTQLSRRLTREGRLLHSATYEPFAPGQRHELLLPTVKGEAPDQAALGGLKFTTTRNRYEILQEHRHVWQTVYQPKQYFARVLRAVQRIKAHHKHKLPRRQQWRLDRGFLNLVRRLSRIPGVRWPLWWMLLRAFFLGRARFEHAARMAVAYLQFHKIRRRIEEGLPDRIRYERSKNVPEVWEPRERPTADPSPQPAQDPAEYVSNT
ncbi:MAG: B12-binding domain-containing radical SAM protein [Pirellulales bacterium]